MTVGLRYFATQQVTSTGEIQLLIFVSAIRSAGGNVYLSYEVAYSRMKTLLTLGLLTLTLGSALAAPTAAAASQTSRPLVRYLTATLHLRRHKARQVERAVLRNPLDLSTPEQVADRLRPVLTASQYEQYADLQNNGAAYQMLQRLAVQR